MVSLPEGNMYLEYFLAPQETAHEEQYEDWLYKWLLFLPFCILVTWKMAIF